MTTITLTDHQLTILKALVEYAALNTPNGARADETTEIYLRHITRGDYAGEDDNERNLSGFISKAREALLEQA